jgi:PRC-barrel domain
VDAGSGYRAVGTFAGWELRDPLGRRVGRVSRVFVDGAGRAAHVEVSLGPFGTRTVLLPVEGVRVDREGRAISLGESRGRPAGGSDGA